MDGSDEVISWIDAEFSRYKKLGEGTMAQLGPDQLVVRASAGSLSIATLVWHIAGNLKSRFTDFLTSDGEKPWRHRDEEFEPRVASVEEVLRKWEAGWQVLFDSLKALKDSDLERQVTIRQQPLFVREALVRSLAHAASHVGQIVLLARAARGAGWTYLSIPPGKSDEYNKAPTLERIRPVGR